MTVDVRIDQLLAAVLRGEAPTWPGDLDAEAVRERLGYHGIAGLVAARSPGLANWPGSVLEAARTQAIASAMWELQHQGVVSRLFDALAAAGVDALLLKGTALAYDLYPVPATRERGDSDVLIAKDDREKARRILTQHGFAPPPPDAAADRFALQEGWTLRAANGLEHHIDLHWQLLNSPALAAAASVDECQKDARALPRLGPNARSMRHAMSLFHSCLHRAMHLTSPYFVDGRTYYGGDRLIWAIDIDLLARSLSDAEWADFARMARRQGVAAVCRDGLESAHGALGTTVPAAVRADLNAASDGKGSAYLLESSQFGRARRDLLSVPGAGAKLAYVAARLLPRSSFIRAKYPELAGYPLLFSYARRMIDLVRPRRSEPRR